MTTSVTVRVNGSYVREVTVGDAEPVKVGPGDGVERTWQHHECADKVVTVGAERSATAEEIAAAAEAKKAAARDPSSGAA